ncbi:hypothetical protein [uncultured Methanolobus sp.]|uniref:hypothetical protein n=1 Tax=uncultured Methanolobus sp. TaxID=218300 RepID=UPI002AAC1DA9|nr:hypothetical protein [uncultured Methanolobus sp.]
MKERHKALLVSYNKAPFVICDYYILSEIFECDLFLTGDGKKSHIFTGYRLTILFLKLLFGRFTLVYVWGLDFNSLVPAILKRFLNIKLIIVPLGYELNKVEEINYGNNNTIKKAITSYAASKADRIICQSIYISDQAKKSGFETICVHLCMNK